MSSPPAGGSVHKLH